jgi:hypothetical protein
VPTRQQTEAHRRDLGDLTRLAQNDLRILLTPITDAELARDALLVALPQLVNLYGSAAATLAADWYDDLRDAEAGRARRFRSVTAELPDPERTEILARYAVGPLFQAEPDMPTAISLAAGGLQRIIADADRQTISRSSIADPAAKGWEWSSSGGCPFCTEHDGTFYNDPDSELRSHDYCSCLAVPGFG